MLTAVIHLHIRLYPAAGNEGVDPGPSPIAVDPSELIWGGASFLVFLVLFRYYLYPRLRKGMDDRYNGIRADHENADAERSAARSEIAEYEAQIASVKAEAAVRVDAARQQLEVERQERIDALNVQLAERRATAQAENEAAKAAVRDQIHSAVADVAGRAGELATGRRPDDSVVARVVDEVMAR